MSGRTISGAEGRRVPGTDDSGREPRASKMSLFVASALPAQGLAAKSKIERWVSWATTLNSEVGPGRQERGWTARAGLRMVPTMAEGAVRPGPLRLLWPLSIFPRMV